MPAYMISHVKVTDQQKFQDYIAQTRAIASTFGGKPVAIGTNPKMLSGESDGHMMVFVIEFDSMDVLDTWHESDEYQAIIPLREEGSDQHMVAYESMGLPPL